MIFKKCILFLTILLLFFLTRNSLIAEELDSDVLLEKAKLQFLWKNYENAFGMAETILKTDPKNTDALMIVAQVHYIKSRYKEAREAFEKIISINPANQTVFMRDYGIVLKSAGETEKARKSLETYISEQPDDSLALYHLSEIYYRAGEKDKAESVIKKVYNKKDEQMVPAAVLLSDIYISHGKNSEAEKLLRSLESERLSQLSDQIVNGLYGRATSVRERYKKLSLEVSAGVGFDTNGIYFTEAEKAEKTDKDSAYSEIYAEAVYNPYITARKRLYIGLSLLKNFYFSEVASQFDSLLVNPKAGYKFYTDEERKTFLDFGYSYKNLFFSGGERVGFGSFGSYYQSNGIFGELNHRFGKTTGIARYEFSFDEFYDHSRSGFSHRLLLVSSFPVYKKWNFYLGPVLSLDDARLNLYDFFSAGATAGVQVRLSGNSGFVMSGGYEHREYFDNSEERNDNIFIFAARAEYYIFDNVFITTSAVYFSDNSSLKQYTFDRWLLFLGTGLVY